MCDIPGEVWIIDFGMAAKIRPAPLLTGDPSLPAAFHAIHPYNVIVNTNGVLIRVGVGRESYAIVWHRKDNDPNTWELKTNAEGESRSFFEKKT